MTYKQLAQRIQDLPEPVQNCDVSIYVSGVDEHYEVALAFSSGIVLEEGHPMLVAQP